jgi:hypothetical protein
MKSNWTFPLKSNYNWPTKQGMFGANRKFDIHTGVDLYCDPKSYVFAVEDGKIIAIDDFTGQLAGSPWWHETKALLVEGESGVVCYGEIEPIYDLEVGHKVQAGDIIGKVLTVLKKDKGLPMTMLHIELYKSGTTEPITWMINEKKPENLLNPMPYLIDSKDRNLTKEEEATIIEDNKYINKEIDVSEIIAFGNIPEFKDQADMFLTAFKVGRFLNKNGLSNHENIAKFMSILDDPSRVMFLKQLSNQTLEAMLINKAYKNFTKEPMKIVSK